MAGHLDAIMADEYILTHTSEATAGSRCCRTPMFMRVIETEMKKQFASYDSATRPKTDKSEPISRK